jgi:hypothetical protein
MGKYPLAVGVSRAALGEEVLVQDEPSLKPIQILYAMEAVLWR